MYFNPFPKLLIHTVNRVIVIETYVTYLSFTCYQENECGVPRPILCIHTYVCTFDIFYSLKDYMLSASIYEGHLFTWPTQL